MAPRPSWRLRISLLLGLALLAVAAGGAAAAAVDNDASASASSGIDKPPSVVMINHHKPLLPLDTWDYVTFLVGAIGLIVAAAGGIGGGGVLVPLYIIIAGFDAKSAVALSNITILGSAISNVVLAAARRHPSHDKPLIDWSLIMIMEPPVIAGAVIGSLVNKVLPSLVVTICLVLTLSFMAKRTMTKGLKLWKQEGGWQGVFGRGGHTLGGGEGEGGLPSQHQAGETQGLVSGGGGQQRQGPKYGGATFADLDEDAVRRVRV